MGRELEELDVCCTRTWTGYIVACIRVPNNEPYIYIVQDAQYGKSFNRE